MKSLQLSNYIRAYKLNGESQRILKNARNITIDTVLNDMKTLEFTLPYSESLQTEQNLIYRNERFIVKKIEQSRQNGKVVTAYSAFIELTDRTIKKIEFQNLSFQAATEKILNNSGWTVGHVEEISNEVFAMIDENKTRMYLLRELARVSGYEIEFDTINRKVNFVKSVGRQTDFIFRYAKNLKEIKKTEYAPEATVIYPRGAGGLTIESVNGGKDYLEDYSWYNEQGMTLQEARARYRKEYVWEDERFIYAGTLMRAAQEKLAVLSRPQISYEAKVIDINAGQLKIGDYAHVIDEELGIKLSVRVVRIKQYPLQEWKNEIEFNYLIPGLTDTINTGSTAQSSRGEQLILVKNQSDLTIDSNYSTALEMNITSYVSTNLQCGLTLVGQASATSAIIHAYLTFNGNRVGPYIRQSVNGWATIGVPFILAQIPEGSGTLALLIKIESGTFSIANGDAELFVKGENLFGGMSSDLPRANVVEEVTYTNINVSENNLVTKQIPIKSTNTETVTYSSLNITENISITLE